MKILNLTSLENSRIKYKILEKLYLERNKERKSSSYIKKVNAIQTIDEVVRRIFFESMIMTEARNFSQTEECSNLLNKGK